MARNFPTVTALVNAKLFPKEQCVSQSSLLKFCSYKQQLTRPCSKMWSKTVCACIICVNLSTLDFVVHTHTVCCWLLYCFVLLSNCVSLFFYVPLFPGIWIFCTGSAKNVNLCQARGILINEELCWINFTGHKILHRANKKLNSTFRPFKPQTAVKFPYWLHSYSRTTLCCCRCYCRQTQWLLWCFGGVGLLIDMSMFVFDQEWSPSHNLKSLKKKQMAAREAIARQTVSDAEQSSVESSVIRSEP